MREALRGIELRRRRRGASRTGERRASAAASPAALRCHAAACSARLLLARCGSARCVRGFDLKPYFLVAAHRHRSASSSTTVDLIWEAMRVSGTNAARRPAGRHRSSVWRCRSCCSRFQLLDELVTPLSIALNAIPIFVLVAVFNNMFSHHQRGAAAADGHARRVLRRARQRGQGTAPGRRPTHVELMRSLRRQRLDSAAQGAGAQRGARTSSPALQDRRAARRHHRLRVRVLRWRRRTVSAARITSNIANSKNAEGWAYVGGACLLGLAFYLFAVVLEIVVATPGGSVQTRSERRMSAPTHQTAAATAVRRGRRPAMRKQRIRGVIVAMLALSLVAAACGSTTTSRRHRAPPTDEPTRPRHRRTEAPTHRGTAATEAGDGECTEPTAGEAAAAVGHPGPVRRLLRRRRPGLLRRRSASTSPSSKVPSTSRRRPCSPTARPTSPSRGCPRRSPAARPVPTSSTSPRCSSARAPCRCRFKDTGITSPADFAGKKIGNWGFGNEFEVFAAMTKAGLDPATDVDATSQQQFDMVGLLDGDIDAAEAMTYNEYAQVLEAMNPDTGELYTPDDFNVISYEDEGVGMLQDAIWADGTPPRRRRPTSDTAIRFVAASLQGWAYCRDNVEACADIVIAKGSILGAQPPAVADERGQQAHLAGRRAASASSTGRVGPHGRDRPGDEEPRGRDGAHRSPRRGVRTPTTSSTAAHALLEGLGVDINGDGLRADRGHPHRGRRLIRVGSSADLT